MQCSFTHIVENLSRKKMIALGLSNSAEKRDYRRSIHVGADISSENSLLPKRSPSQVLL